MTHRTAAVDPHTGVTRRAGSVNVRVHLTDTGLYRVETTDSRGVLDDWTRTLPNRAEAVAAFTHVRAAFEVHGTAQAVEARHKALTFKVRDLLNARRDTTRELAAIEAELDSIATLSNRAAYAAALGYAA